MVKTSIRSRLPEYRGHTNFDGLLALVAFACALVLLVFLAGMYSAFAADSAVFGGEATGAPWWIVLAIILAPGGAAVFLTITCMAFVKRINQAAGRGTLGVFTQVAWVIGLGILWGPLMQWGLQYVISDLTGLGIYWRLIVIAPFITGLASIGTYEFILIPLTRKKYPGVYKALKGP